MRIESKLNIETIAPHVLSKVQIRTGQTHLYE